MNITSDTLAAADRPGTADPRNLPGPVHVPVTPAAPDTVATASDPGTAPSAPTAATTAQPFGALDPETLLTALESVGLAPDGRLLALNSFENRVYQFWRDDAPPLIAKFYRPGRWSDAQIDEEHRFLAELAADEVPAVAPLTLAGRTLNRAGPLRFAVFPRQGGRAPELDRPDARRQLGRFLARTHVVGSRTAFGARPTLDVAGYGRAALADLAALERIPAAIAAVYLGVAGQALDAAEAAWARAGAPRNLRLHGDCHLGNVLWTDGGPHFVDFDDARQGPAVQDLWMLLCGEREEQERQLRELLEGYETFRDFDRGELHLVEALRTLRLIHHAAWIARRWEDPAFPAAFPWFATPRYWEARVLELREQIALLDEPPLAA
jgi:Ser/Thr protein kinase RdoA (MazF antagonist)